MAHFGILQCTARPLNSFQLAFKTASIQDCLFWHRASFRSTEDVSLTAT